jgi:hypothetical protein
MPRSSRKGDRTGRMAGATLMLLIALAFALGWFLPRNPQTDGYNSRSIGPPENEARFNDPVRGVP